MVNWKTRFVDLTRSSVFQIFHVNLFSVFVCGLTRLCWLWLAVNGGIFSWFILNPMFVLVERPTHDNGAVICQPYLYVVIRFTVVGHGRITSFRCLYKIIKRFIQEFTLINY